MVKPSENIPQQRKLLLPFLSTAVAMLAGALIFAIPPPAATQFHKTTVGQHKSIAVTPDITLLLDANTAITVTNNRLPKVELIQGNAYFDSKHLNAGIRTLEIIVADSHFWNMGATFSLQKLPKGGSIAIAHGQLEMTLDNQVRQISAGQRIDFDHNKITEESSTVGLDIAPWRHTPSF